MAKNKITRAITSGTAMVIEGTLGPFISGFFVDFSVDFVIEDPHTRHLVAFALILEPQIGQVDD